MLTWMILVYALIRYISLIKRILKHFLNGLLILLGYISLTFHRVRNIVPLVYGFLNASRSPGPPPISLFGVSRYYGLLIINSLTPGTIFGQLVAYPF